MSRHIPDSFVLQPDLDRGPRRAAWILVASLGVFLILALVWMSFASLDIAVHAPGKVVPSSRVQTVQNLEGGIVRQILVREGQRVKRGDLLAVLENQQYTAELAEDRQAEFALRANIARLEAELNGTPPDFSPELRAQAADLVAQQYRFWLAREGELRSALGAVRQQVSQRQEELNAARLRVDSLTQLLETARESLTIEQRLHAGGGGARVDLLRAQQEVARLEGELEFARATIPRIQAALEEARGRMAELKARYRAESGRERAEAEAKLKSLRERMAASQDRVSRRELRAPMDAVVNRLNIHTEGAVAKPGETVMELVPAQDRLLIVVRVKPSDIAFIRVGQAVQVRIDAYDASIYGSLEGKVTRVGADALTDAHDPQKEPYFEVHVETERDYLGTAQERLTISPGMTADVSIMTGKRTLMEYLLKPVVKTLDKSLGER